MITPSPVEIHGGRFYNEDCIQGAKRHLPDSSVDLIVTDPPYGINGDLLHKHYNRKEGFVVDGYVEVPAAEYSAFSHRWIEQAARVLRPGGQIYVVSGYTHLLAILEALRDAGLEEINHIIWKYNFGVFTRTKYVSSHYHILYCAKPGGKRTFNTESRFGLREKDSQGQSLNYEDREDVWMINREYKPGQVKNKNELPMALLTKMIQYSSGEADLVADFFLGGFSTARVALELNRRIVGFEISRGIFKARIPEMRKVVPGRLLSDLRVPRIDTLDHQGRKWTEAETDSLLRRYYDLRKKRTKKATVEVLIREFGRGRFSIEKVLSRQKPEHQDEPRLAALTDFN